MDKRIKMASKEAWERAHEMLHVAAELQDQLIDELSGPELSQRVTAAVKVLADAINDNGINNGIGTIALIFTLAEYHYTLEESTKKVEHSVAVGGEN